MKVLDIGTGPGAIPFHLKKRYSDASFTGLDISPGILQKAMRGQKGNSGPVAFLCGDGEALPFGPQTVDVILSFFALHHMDHPEHLLMEIDRVLKPGGILLMIDFRRDMAHGLYRFLNALWKTAFFFTAGRSGFEDSVQSAWLPDEMDSRLKHIGSNRFRLHANPMELWVMANIGESDA
jgi:ubiquinone/menaquinone biosynthesis C-methylase UbiE